DENVGNENLRAPRGGHEPAPYSRRLPCPHAAGRDAIPVFRILLESLDECLVAESCSSEDRERGTSEIFLDHVRRGIARVEEKDLHQRHGGSDRLEAQINRARIFLDGKVSDVLADGKIPETPDCGG